MPQPPRSSRSRMIAVAFGPPTMAEALAGLPRIRAVADCVELRLDLFREAIDLPVLLSERGELPVVVTLRPPDQGGASHLAPGERLDVLMGAAELGAEYVDLEWDMVTPEAVAALHDAGAQVIVSRHDFTGMPAEFAEMWWSDLAERDADVVKIVGTAHDVRDCLPALRALRRADRPTIAMAMGVPGLPSRVLALREEPCLLTYASLDPATATAPGQVSIDDMHGVYRARRLGPGTAIFGLLGAQIDTERAAEYNTWFASANQDALAVPFPASAEAAVVVDAFRELPVSGWHVHGPELQQTVGQALDGLAASACHQGKVNAVVRGADGGLVGHWVETPREQYELWASAL